MGRPVDGEGAVKAALTIAGLDGIPSSLDESATGSSTAELIAYGLARGESQIGLRSLLAALDEGQESVALQVLGDSTGNETDEWVYLTALYLAARYPTVTVNSLLFNDSTGVFDATTVQTGAAGARYLQTAITGTSNLVPNAEIPMFTSDLDIRVKVLPDAWVPGGSQQCFVAKFGAAGNRTFRFELNPSGSLFYDYSTNGTTLVSQNSTVVIPGTAAGVPMWLRVTHTMNNAASGTDIKFYKSGDGTNGTSWTQIGATVTNAGALTTLFTSTADWEVGARAGTGDPSACKFYGIDIRQGLAGASLAPQAIDAWQPFSTTAGTFGGAPVLTIVNASVPGKGLTYLSGNSTYSLATLTPKWGQAAILLSCSHNDNGQYGPTYLALWDAWLTALKARFPESSIVVLSQNPRTGTAIYLREHTIRRRQLMAWAAKNACGFVDTFRAFRLDGRAIGTLIDPSDGVHPLPGTGRPLWATAIQNAMTGRRT